MIMATSNGDDIPSGSGQNPSQFQSLIRQGSLCSLTLNEVETQLGGPLLSMNFDELLKSVFPADFGQPSVAVDADAPSSKGDVCSGLHRQGSMTVPKYVSKQTVDEVWKGIQSRETTKEQCCSRQPTLGELTLEEFLIKAGVVLDGSLGIDTDIGGSNLLISTMPDFSSSVGQWDQQYQQPPGIAVSQQRHCDMFGGYVANHPLLRPLPVGGDRSAAFAEGQMGGSSPGKIVLSDSLTLGRKGAGSDGMPDKVTERRHKRMMKNRESAARSRARKQAYANELENKVSRLEQENEKLKKQKEIEEIFCATPPSVPKYRLRRTSSTLL